MRWILGFLILLACNNTPAAVPVPPPPPPPSPPPPGPALQLLGTFSAPVFVTSPPGDTARLFVVEKVGRIRVLRHDTLLATPFFDIRGKINQGSDEGLLSLAFHPDYATNGRFYVYFTDTLGDNRIVRYTVSADPNVADPASADTVLKLAHPTYANHNGGLLLFGPDGMLYAGTGDGGGGGDPAGNGQNTQALLGKLLRLNVDGASGYPIPADNPFASGASGAPEVWAYGLRNPWRFSFDRTTGDLYIADVGQGAWEEVNVARAADGRGPGANYGWNEMEGGHCYPIGTTCTPVGVLPVLEYAHADGACSITGGYVYRGTRVAALAGRYLYADYCAGFVKSFELSGGAATNLQTWTTQLAPGGNISSFGEDAEGDVYVMTLGGGVYRIVTAP